MHTIICFGDSITGPDPTTSYQNLYLKWTDLLGFALRTHRPNVSTRVINSGLAGNTGCDAPARLQRDVLAHHPSLTLLLLGGNDFSPRLDHPECVKEELSQSLLSMGRAILASGSELLILQYPHAQAARESTAWHHLECANPILADTAQVLGVPTLSLTPAFQAAEASGIARDQLRDPTDGVHLRPLGEIVFAEAILPATLSLLDAQL